MPSPATVFILFVVSLAGVSADQTIPRKVIDQDDARLDEFADPAACSLACAVSRLFHDKTISPDDLPALVVKVCQSLDPQMPILLRREAQYDAVFGLIERLLLSRSTSESVMAEALSLLVCTVGQVAADVISGTVFPVDSKDRDCDRICRIRARIKGLDFTDTPVADLPWTFLHDIELFVKAARLSKDCYTEYLELPLDAMAVPLQYDAPFCDVSPNNAALSDYLLMVRQRSEVFCTRRGLLRLMRLGLSFEAGAFLGAVSVPGAVLAEIYPLLRKNSKTDWFEAVGKMIDRNDVGAINALFRTGDFVERLSAAADGKTRFLGLCAGAVMKRRDPIFTVLAGHPLMAQVINMPLEESVDVRRGTLLHLAARLNRVAVVSVLMSFPGLQTTVEDAHGRTPFHYTWLPSRIRWMLRHKTPGSAAV